MLSAISYNIIYNQFNQIWKVKQTAAFLVSKVCIWILYFPARLLLFQIHSLNSFGWIGFGSDLLLVVATSRKTQLILTQ